MKAFEEKEIGYILSKTRGDVLRKDSLGLYRTALTQLFHLGLITMKQKQNLELELDKIIYGIKNE